MQKVKSLVFIFALYTCFPLQGQDFIFGPKYGYGTASYTRQSDGMKLEESAQHRVAFVMEFSPFLAGVFFISGVEYISNDFTASVSIPLTIRVTAGKKVRPFVEGGGYYNSSITDKADNYAVENDWGAKTGAGLLFAPNKWLRFDAGYFWRFGLTPGLEEEVLLPLGQIQYEEYHLREGSFEISIRYRF
jgi:hypothetical protein